MTENVDITKCFSEHEEKIAARWIDYTLSTYTSSEFFKNETDPFANPIGGTVNAALRELLSLLIQSAGRSAYQKPLQEIIAIRAVQQFSPSQAVAPINAVKHIVREVFAAEKKGSSFSDGLYDFDFAVDIALLAAFDLYMEFRERLYSVRLREIKSGSSVLTDSRCPSKLLKGEESGLVARKQIQTDVKEI